MPIKAGNYTIAIQINIVSENDNSMCPNEEWNFPYCGKLTFLSVHFFVICQKFLQAYIGERMVQ